MREFALLVAALYLAFCVACARLLAPGEEVSA